MFIEKLTKEERLIASEFHPEKWEGEYVKIIVSYGPKYSFEKEKITYYKLSKYLYSQKSWCAFTGCNYIFQGFGINEWHQPLIKFGISSNYSNEAQYEITPISREEFIEGCQSLLPDDLKEFINWDKI